MTAWGNLALSRSQARGISIGRLLFSTGQLAFADRNWGQTDLDQTVTASAGASRRFGSLLLSADLLNPLVVPLLEVRVVGMPVLFIRVVAGGVVAA